MSRLYIKDFVTHFGDAKKPTHALCGVDLCDATNYDPNKGISREFHSKPMRFISCKKCWKKYFRAMEKRINKEYKQPAQGE